MWNKIIDYFLTQGALGIAVMCLGFALLIFYKDGKVKDENHTKERNDIIEKFIDLSNRAVAFIQENTLNLKELRDDMKEDRTQRDRINERMIDALECTLKNYK